MPGFDPKLIKPDKPPALPRATGDVIEAVRKGQDRDPQVEQELTAIKQLAAGRRATLIDGKQ